MLWSAQGSCYEYHHLIPVHVTSATLICICSVRSTYFRSCPHFTYNPLHSAHKRQSSKVNGATESHQHHHHPPPLSTPPVSSCPTGHWRISCAIWSSIYSLEWRFLNFITIRVLKSKSRGSSLFVRTLSFCPVTSWLAGRYTLVTVVTFPWHNDSQLLFSVQRGEGVPRRVSGNGTNKAQQHDAVPEQSICSVSIQDAPRRPPLSPNSGHNYIILPISTISDPFRCRFRPLGQSSWATGDEFVPHSNRSNGFDVPPAVLYHPPPTTPPPLLPAAGSSVIRTL